MTAQSVKKKKTTTQHLKPQKNSLQKESFRIPSWAIYAVLVITALVYTRALFNDFATWDDNGYINENPDIREFSFDGIKKIFSSFYMSNYQPLTMLTYLLEFRLFGLNPFPYHLFSVLLHLVNVFLVYRFIEKLSSRKFTALFVAAMFALHPMHVESVAWIAERKDVLYTLFYLAALLVYVNYYNNHKIKDYLLCLFLFLFSLLSKSAAVTLPVVMIAIDLYKGRKINVKMFLEKLPFFALSLLFGIVALFSQEEARSDYSLVYSFVDRIFLFSYALSYYITQLFAPFHLSAMHYYPFTHGGPLPWFFYASLPFLLVLVWWTVKKSTLRREKIFGVMFFLIVISIMLQVVAVGAAIVAERYTYVSYIGFFYIAGQWISNIQKQKLKKLALVIIALYVLAFSYLTWNRIKVWENCIVLFTDVIKKYPNHPDGYNTRGIFKKNMEDYQGALQDYNKSLQLNPVFNDCLIGRGSVFIEFKDYKAALADLNLSIEIDSTMANAYNNRGMALQGLNDTAAALRDFNKAILLEPEHQGAYNNRSILKAIMGNLQGALADANKALEISPDESIEYCTRANIRTFMKDYQGAVEDYNKGLQLKPDDNEILFNRGMARLNLNDTAGACEDWHRSLNLGDKNAENMINQHCK